MTQTLDRVDTEAVRILGRVDAIEQAHAVEQELDAVTNANLGITFNQLLVLSEVTRRVGRATCTSLSEDLERRPHTVTSALNGLERKKLIQRTHVRGEDRRTTRLAATVEGLLLVKGVEGIKHKLRKAIRPLEDERDLETGGRLLTPRSLSVCRLLGYDVQS